MYFRPNLAYNGSVLAKPIKTSLNKRSYDEAKCSLLKACRESKQEPVI